MTPSTMRVQSGERSARSWFSVDAADAIIVAIPAFAGASPRARLQVIERGSKEVITEVESEDGQTISAPIERATTLSALGARLLEMRDGRWQPATDLVPVSTAPDAEVQLIAPSEWGVDVDCIVQLRDVARPRTVLRRWVTAGSSFFSVVEFPDGRKLQMDVFAVPDDGRGIGRRLLPPIRLVPLAQRGTPDARAMDASRGALSVSRRRSVTLAPIALSSAGRGGLATHGAIGAWDDDGPIVEAMEYALGRQRYQYLDRPESFETQIDDPVIYAGLPHASFGHFLIQGLDRIWYALQHPELPLLWDARELPQYQLDVLDAIGVVNEHRFLTDAVQAREVHFPYPGVSLGDYMDPAYADAIGAVAPAPIVPGKRLLLSRAAMHRGNVGTEGGRSIESITAEFGFTPFAPELHALDVQLAELSSAETVLGVEGSAFHSLILLRGTPQTRYWALTRHRGGSGIFQHIKTAKRLHYETLDLLRSRRGGASGAIDLDLDLLHRALASTDGLSSDLDALVPYIERPSTAETRIQAHLRNTQVRMTSFESDMQAAAAALRRRDVDTARTIVTSYV